MTTLDPGVPGRRRGWIGRSAKKKGRRTEEEKTLSVPEAGWRYFRLSKNGSYAAADRGDIPTIRIGKLRRVPVNAMERMLETAR